MSFEVFLRECAVLGLTITLEPIVVDNVAGYRALVAAGGVAPCTRLSHEAVVIGSEVVTREPARKTAQRLPAAAALTMRYAEPT